jgi:hypothetical protein
VMQSTGLKAPKMPRVLQRDEIRPECLNPELRQVMRTLTNPSGRSVVSPRSIGCRSDREPFATRHSNPG